MTRTALHHLLFLAALLSAGALCGSEAGSQRARSSSISRLLRSRTLFAGVGRAAVGQDTVGAYAKARERALADMSRQIQVTISSHGNVVDSVATRGSRTTFSSTLMDSIASESSVNLSDWHEHSQTIDKSGFCTVVVTLNKRVYREKIAQVRRKAVTLAVQLLRGSRSGTLRERLCCINHALFSAESAGVLGEPVDDGGTLVGVALENALQAVLGTMRIRADSDSVVAVDGSSTVRVRVFSSNQPDTSLMLHCSAGRFLKVGGGYLLNGLAVLPVGISKNLDITVEPLPGFHLHLQTVLAQVGGTVSVFRVPPRICLADTYSESSEIFTRELEGSGSITVSTDPSQAQYLVRFACDLLNPPANSDSMHRFGTNVRMVVERRDGTPVLVWAKHVSAVDGVSRARAQQRAYAAAAGMAVDRILEVL